MHLISVNVGLEQPISKAKRSGKSGIFKQPQSGPVQIHRLGLEGDAIVDKKNHGGRDQAVYIYGGADLEWWSRELGADVEPGTFGENLTISDLESAEYAVGDRLRMGEVVLEVTAPRIPCVTLSARMGDPQFIKRFMAAERPGLYCRVIVEGSVQAGDVVVVERTTRETVTVMEMFRYFFVPLPPRDYLRRFLAAPTPLRGRKKMEEKYHESIANDLV